MAGADALAVALGQSGQLAQGVVEQRFDAFAQAAASTGATPEDEIATITGERSTMDGTWNEDSAGSSTTLQNRRRAWAASETSRLTLVSSVAATTSQTASSQAGSNRPGW